ncbi:MAG: RDD family protein [Cyanobacteria bacterium TGS_CYA1]|nr:RDD family protein [Cyanobacteria bacterium TGS_CYA1]MDX2106434.1 RDD family protein [Candidatus Melainabacteria bacterium]
MIQPDYSISTPENVDLHLELAGLGNRILAALIDQIIAGLTMLAFLIVMLLICMGIDKMGLPTELKSKVFVYIGMFAIFVLFVINTGYNIIFEGLWQGQTPGKHLTHIRVVEANGQPVGWPSVFIRNLIRMIDTGLAFIGLLIMLIDKHERRLGDMAAGTIVIRERTQDLSQDKIELETSPKPDQLMDIGRLSPQDYELLLQFLRRRKKLAVEYRPKLATQLESYLRDKLDRKMQSDETLKAKPEEFLEIVYASYQERANA